jgi:TetR/AcrR family transcriptional regulator, transcriptional repressor for nem operon
MARPREFDEASALDAAMDCFWREGDEATSVRDLAARMGITGASLYNCRQSRRSAPFLARSSNAPSTAIGAAASWSTLRSKIAPHDPELGAEVTMHLGEIEAFSRRAPAAAQEEGYVPPDRDPADLARLLRGVTLGVRVLARSKPQRELLEGVVPPALALLDWPDRASEP